MPMLRAVQLSSKVYSSCGEEGLQCNVLYQWCSLHYQKADRANSLVYLSFSLAHTLPVSRPLNTRKCLTPVYKKTPPPRPACVCYLLTDVINAVINFLHCNNLVFYKLCLLAPATTGSAHGVDSAAGSRVQLTVLVYMLSGGWTLVNLSCEIVQYYRALVKLSCKFSQELLCSVRH